MSFTSTELSLSSILVLIRWVHEGKRNHVKVLDFKKVRANMHLKFVCFSEIIVLGISPLAFLNMAELSNWTFIWLLDLLKQPFYCSEGLEYLINDHPIFSVVFLNFCTSAPTNGWFPFIASSHVWGRDTGFLYEVFYMIWTRFWANWGWASNCGTGTLFFFVLDPFFFAFDKIVNKVLTN